MTQKYEKTQSTYPRFPVATAVVTAGASPSISAFQRCVTNKTMSPSNNSDAELSLLYTKTVILIVSLKFCIEHTVSWTKLFGTKSNFPFLKISVRFNDLYYNYVIQMYCNLSQLTNEQVYWWVDWSAKLRRVLESTNLDYFREVAVCFHPTKANTKF